MDFKAIIHIEESTPPNSRVPLYCVTYNGETMLECISKEELDEVTFGELRKWYEMEMAK